MTTSTNLPINERHIALVGVVNRELVILERLVFRLTQAEMLTRAHESGFLVHVLDEIDVVRNRRVPPYVLIPLD